MRPGLALALPADTDRVIELITRPDIAGVLVLGEMGVGKSALLDVAVRTLGDRLEVLSLHGSPALAKVPYGVLAPFLGDLPSEQAGSRVEVLRAFWRTVEGLRRGTKPDLLLVIDDAHELDPASSEVIAELVSARWTKAVMAAPTGAALPRPLMELWLDGGVERVDLAPLTVHQVQAFLEATLGGRVLPTVPRLLWQECEGNPLVLGRLVEEARRDGTLSLRGQTWVVTGELPHRGEGLLGLARAQLARLTPVEREALSLIVVAEPAPFELVARECGAEAVRRLVATRLVRPAEGPDGVLRLRHPVYGDALLSLIPLTTSVVLRERAAAYITGQTSTAQGLLRAVTWGLDCGFPIEDDSLLAAARLAVRRFENSLAVRAATAVRERRARTAAKEVLGEVAYSRGEYSEAAALLRPLPSRDGSVRPGLTGSLVWIAARWALGDPAEAIQDDVERLPGAGEGGVRDVLALVADSLGGNRDRLATRLRQWHGLQVRGPASAEGRAAETAVRAVEAELLVASGHPRKAAPPLRAALEGAADAGDPTPYVQAFGATRLILADLAAGEWAVAEDDIEQFLMSSNAGLVAEGAAAQTARGLSLARRGLFAEAWDTLVPAVEALSGDDPQHLVALAAAIAAYAGARAGKHDAARGLAAQAQGPADPAVALFRPLAELFAAAAEAALAAQDASAHGLRCAAGLATAVERTSGLGRLDLELQAELLWFESGRRDRLLRLLDVARRTEGGWAETAALLASALAGGEPEALLHTGEQLLGAGSTHYARECFAEASRGFDRALQRSEARAAWARKAQCDALLGEGDLRPIPESARLTPREREVVAFAVAGLSDREIAERLTVSVRTIEGHLYRAYAKLEVTSREQLASAVGGRAASSAGGGSEYTPPTPK